MRVAFLERMATALRRLAAAERANELQLINQGRMLALMNAARAVPNLQAAEFQVFSQSGEDGIIQHLLSLVPVAHRTFVEFGVESFVQANCRFLMMKDNWRGLVIDGSPDNVAAIRAAPWFWQFDLAAEAAFIDAGNIDALIAARGFDSDLGLLSVDIDGNDYWVLSAIRCVRPRIVVVEYNAVFGAERAISVPYDPGFVRSAAHHSHQYFGASLAAFAHWGDANGYALVGTTLNGVNAFFVRDDVRPAALPKLTVAEAFTPSLFREGRDAQGQLNYASGAARLEAIRGLPVVDVTTGRAGTL